MDFLSQLIRIVIIDLVLSGDNAVLIGMAAHRLEPVQRRKAILLGGSAAVVIRILLTAIAAYLLTLKGLQMAGGVLLLWIGFKLLRQEDASHAGIKGTTNLNKAVFTILVADFAMSIDNILGVAGASHGNAMLLIFGLVVSMAILIFLGNLVADVISRIWWLAYAGSGVIAWTGGMMIFEDSLVQSRWPWTQGKTEYAGSAVIMVLTLGVAHWFHRVRKRIRKR